MSLNDPWKQLRILTERESIAKEERSIIDRFLMAECQAREKLRINHLLKMSGIKRVERLEDFDWKFNPKILRENLMEIIGTEWLHKSCNIVIISPAGVGKSHIADALCVDAIMKGHQVVSISIFDLTAKLARARNIYSLIDYYARIKVLCLDEMGYLFNQGAGRRSLSDCLKTIRNRHHHCHDQPDSLAMEQDLRLRNRLGNP